MITGTCICQSISVIQEDMDKFLVIYGQLNILIALFLFGGLFQTCTSGCLFYPTKWRFSILTIIYTSLHPTKYSIACMFFTEKACSVRTIATLPYHQGNV